MTISSNSAPNGAPLLPDAAPIFVGLDATPTYVEGNRVLLDDNATITDNDTSDFAGATLTLHRHSGANPDDIFDSSLFDEGTVYVQKDISGSLINFPVGYYAANGGELVVTFSGDATIDDVNTVLQSITYGNGNDTLPSSIQIDYVFDDGSDATATGNVTIGATPQNDPPTIDGVVASALVQVGGGPLALAPAIVVADTDSTTLQNATIAVTQDFQSGDVLDVNVGTSGLVKSYDNSTGVLTLSGAASLAMYQAVLATLSYSSTDVEPGSLAPSRTVSIVVDDGTDVSDDAPVNIYFAPGADLDGGSVGLGFATSYTENGAAVGIVDTDVSVVRGGYGLNSATIVLTNATVGDKLSVGTLPVGISAAIDTTVAGRITVTLSGGATAAAYETALKAITYSNVGDEVGAAPRDVTVTLSDSMNSSDAVHTTIAVAPLNDAPTVAIAGPLSATEGVSLSLKGSTLQVGDPDGGGAVLTVTLAVGQGVLQAAAGDSGVSIVSGEGTKTLVVSGTLANLRSFPGAGGTSTLSFVETSDTPAASTGLILTVNDNGNIGGGALADTDTAVINIVAVDDAPSSLNVVKQLTQLPETASTTFEQKVADIVVGDVDGNTALSLSGADAFLFNLKGTELFLNAGAALDFETNPTLDVIVNADGGGAHISSGLSIYLTDVPEEITGSSTEEKLKGSSSSEILRGKGGDDTIKGNGGKDTIIGGRGADVLTGGDGKDVFVFNLGHFPKLNSVDRHNPAHSFTSPYDLITDFQPNKDKIDLSAIDANAHKNGNQAFHFEGRSELSGLRGELVYQFGNDDGPVTVILGDANGNGLADFRLVLDGHRTLDASDFIL